MARAGAGFIKAPGQVYLSGLHEVTSRLTAEIKKIDFKSKAGLWEAGLMVKRRAQQYTPVDTGNLRSSAYTEAYTTILGHSVEIGYTASYAVFVHEMDPARLRRPLRGNARWKFLETALKELEPDIIRVIKERAYV
jgi:hypothetical protein